MPIFFKKKMGQPRPLFRFIFGPPKKFYNIDLLKYIIPNLCFFVSLIDV